MIKGGQLQVYMHKNLTVTALPLLDKTLSSDKSLEQGRLLEQHHNIRMKYASQSPLLAFLIEMGGLN